MLRYKDYYSQPLDNHRYYLVCRGPDSIFSYVDSIQNDSHIAKHSGELIVDQVLVAGDNPNRFALIPYQNGQLLLSKAKSIAATDEFRKTTSSIFKKNLSDLQYSILTTEQKFRVINNQPL